jgi:hypothetical protein
MGCCGRARQSLGAILNPPVLAEPNDAPRRTSVEFQYVGASALTLIGPVSGRRYRFGGPGARLVIDPRDRPGLARVSRLRQIN